MTTLGDNFGLSRQWCSVGGDSLFANYIVKFVGDERCKK